MRQCIIYNEGYANGGGGSASSCTSAAGFILHYLMNGCALHYIMCFPLTLMEGLQWELAA